MVTLKERLNGDDVVEIGGPEEGTGPVKRERKLSVIEQRRLEPLQDGGSWIDPKTGRRVYTASEYQCLTKVTPAPEYEIGRPLYEDERPWEDLILKMLPDDHFYVKEVRIQRVKDKWTKRLDEMRSKPIHASTLLDWDDPDGRRVTAAKERRRQWKKNAKEVEELCGKRDDYDT